MGRTTIYTAEEIIENRKKKKREYYLKNKEKLNEINLNNYYGKIGDDVKLEKIKKIILTMEDPGKVFEFLELI